MAEQNRQTWPPCQEKFWQEGLEFWQDWMVGPPLTSRPKRSRFCHIFLVQSLVWKYCLKLEGCLHNFFLIGPYSAAAEPNSAPKIVTQFLEPSLVLLRRFCLNVRILRMSLNPRNHRCRYTLHSWSLVQRLLSYLCYLLDLNSSKLSMLNLVESARLKFWFFCVFP